MQCSFTRQPDNKASVPLSPANGSLQCKPAPSTILLPSAVPFMSHFLYNFKPIAININFPFRYYSLQSAGWSQRLVGKANISGLEDAIKTCDSWSKKQIYLKCTNRLDENHIFLLLSRWIGLYLRCCKILLFIDDDVLLFFSGCRLFNGLSIGSIDWRAEVSIDDWRRQVTYNLNLKDLNWSKSTKGLVQLKFLEVQVLFSISKPSGSLSKSFWVPKKIYLDLKTPLKVGERHLGSLKNILVLK